MSEVLRGLKYATHVVFHPFDGFWDIKHENRGNVKSATVILLLAVILQTLRLPMSGFIFGKYTYEYFNFFTEALGMLAPFILWCVANWCLTTLMDGEGTFKDIYIASSYALAPLIAVNIVLVFMSHILTIDEADFFKMISTIGIIWVAMLLVFGTMTVHQYTFGKTIFTAVLIIAGMALIIFIGLLFITLCAEIYNFVISLYREIAFRYY